MSKTITFQVTKVYRNRTTIPEEMRKLLNIKNGDSVVWKKIGELYTISKSVKTERDRFKYSSG